MPIVTKCESSCSLIFNASKKIIIRFRPFVRSLNLFRKLDNRNKPRKLLKYLDDKSVNLFKIEEPVTFVHKILTGKPIYLIYSQIRKKFCVFTMVQ